MIGEIIWPGKGLAVQVADLPAPVAMQSR